MTDWAALLDAMEDGLESFPPVLVDVDVLPADPGPVPFALRNRALRMLHRMAEVESALEQHRAEIGRQLVALSAARATVARAAAPMPYFLDAKA